MRLDAMKIAVQILNNRATFNSLGANYNNQPTAAELVSFAEVILNFLEPPLRSSVVERPAHNG